MGLGCLRGVLGGLVLFKGCFGLFWVGLGCSGATLGQVWAIWVGLEMFWGCFRSGLGCFGWALGRVWAALGAVQGNGAAGEASQLLVEAGLAAGLEVADDDAELPDVLHELLQVLLQRVELLRHRHGRPGRRRRRPAAASGAPRMRGSRAGRREGGQGEGRRRRPRWRGPVRLRRAPTPFN